MSKYYYKTCLPKQMYHLSTSLPILPHWSVSQQTENCLLPHKRNHSPQISHNLKGTGYNSDGDIVNKVKRKSSWASGSQKSTETGKFLFF